MHVLSGEESLPDEPPQEQARTAARAFSRRVDARPGGIGPTRWALWHRPGECCTSRGTGATVAGCRSQSAAALSDCYCATRHGGLHRRRGWRDHGIAPWDHPYAAAPCPSVREEGTGEDTRGGPRPRRGAVAKEIGTFAGCWRLPENVRGPFRLSRRRTGRFFL